MPAITHGPRAGGQHTVSEWVEIDDLVRVAWLYATATALVFATRLNERLTEGSTTMMATTTEMPDLISEAQTTEEAFLRQIFVRDQMAEWSKQPLVMARADGIFYWDVHGKRYHDAISGIYVASVGHNNRRVIEAIRQQYEALAFSPPMHGTNPQAVQLANLLAELAPGDLSTVKFQTGGRGEVVEAAIKLGARQYHKLTGSPGKYKIISRYQSWHGSTLGALSAAGLKSRKTVNEPMAPGFIHVFPPTCYRCPFGKTYFRLWDHLRHDRRGCNPDGRSRDSGGHLWSSRSWGIPAASSICPRSIICRSSAIVCDRHNILLIFGTKRTPSPGSAGPAACLPPKRSA